jgi:hypothetical protein
MRPSVWLFILLASPAAAAAPATTTPAASAPVEKKDGNPGTAHSQRKAARLKARLQNAGPAEKPKSAAEAKAHQRRRRNDAGGDKPASGAQQATGD